MKYGQILSLLVLALMLTLGGSGVLMAGERCCVLDDQGKCVPCDEAADVGLGKTDVTTSASTVKTTFAQPSQAQFIPVRVISADGSQRIVAIPVSVFLGSLGGCGSGGASPCSQAGQGALGSFLINSELSSSACVPGTQCGDGPCKPCPPGSCPPTKGIATDDDSSI